MSSKIQQIIEIITKGAGKSEKQVKGVSGALGGLAKQAGIAAAAYFGTRALLNGIKSSIDLFAKQELAEKKLEVALGRTSKMLLNQASALQKSTMFGDEAIIEAQALIGSFVKEEKAIAAATKATLDLAAAKGMDLVVAADLVSKTLGSSTNALSRYGIQVTGAVGSTERLESLTGNLADVFGGQATEQSDTLAGALESMDNAMGDLQEKIGSKLAPELRRLAENFTNIITIKPSEEIIKEQEEFTSLLRILKDVNSSTSSRELAIKTLKSEYVDYLGDLDIEKASLEDIEKLQTNQVELMQKRIEQMVFAEQLETVEEELIRARMDLFENEMQLRQDGHDQYRKGVQVNIEVAEGTISQLEIEKEKILELIKTYKDKTKVVTEGSKNEKKAVEKVGILQRELNKIQEQESAKAAKMEFENSLNASKAHLIKQIMKHIPFPLNTVLAAGAGTAIDKIFTKNKITAAATGADFITDGPQLMLVGEGKGPEHVQVTPLAGGDPNINGPQGSGMTINIQGSVIGTEEFTEQVLMPQIEEGIRLGNTI